MNFDAQFWTERLTSLNYKLLAEDLDVSALKEQGSIAKDFVEAKVTRLYKDTFTEIALLSVSSRGRLSRGACTRTARLWKQHRLIRPLLLFTNGKESYAVIVPGKGTGGQARILGLEDVLYRTDLEVIQSMQFPGNPEELSRSYDTLFFPYEKVRDEFFSGYRDLYQKIEKAVKRHLASSGSSYAQRFLGRLMFLYFLQRKGWLRSDKQFINKIEDYKEINRLFYESLNREGNEGIPFLNGSLFEREDFMDDDMERKLFKEMDALFKEARGFFNGYNFTVDETSPLEVEVSIDPALIGTVFENMLPEHERGTKGVFYTPIAEASFICRRALSNYLGLHDEITPDGKRFDDGLARQIAKIRESKSEREVREFREKLLSLRILDPAVGSGGFLVVMMQTIIDLIQEAEAVVGWRTDAEEYKKRILPNLYGFDIEPEAIEIARLRLWLSLIIAQKEPEPLPNLDMNLVVIKDSLLLPNAQTSIDPSVEDLRQRFSDIMSKYLNEHSAAKKKLKDQLEVIGKRIAEKTGMNPGVIEIFMPTHADIVVMNPPYVRQEAIPERQKGYYTVRYGLDRKSDIYAYFLVRCISLVNEEGVVSVISSDKWLETGYGISLQKRLKDHLIAIYGQRERSFDADINTVITVYRRGKREGPVHFTNLESYSKDNVIRDYHFAHDDLRPGKWFYLRAPKLFVQTILPKLTRRLGDVAKIKFGIKTGANDFFYMKDVSHLYEADRQSNQRRFEELRVTAKSLKALEDQGLIYIENEGGERFVLNKEDVAPLIRSPKQLGRYRIPKPITYCLYTEKPGKLTKSYIRHGEELDLPDRPTLRGRNPWFELADLKPTRILLPMSMMDKVYISISEAPVICDHRLYTLDCKDPDNLWLYVTSTIFLLTVELYCRRLGGGASDIMVEDYQEMPVPDINNLEIRYDAKELLSRSPMRYGEEVKQADRLRLDTEMLRAMGFEKPEELVSGLHTAFVEVVEDRIGKAGRL